MPTLEFRCENCGQTSERFFRSISSGEKVEEISCPNFECCGVAVKVPSIPLAAHLYGNPAGYHKPSPTKRFNTKTVSQITGNKDACG